jgi:spore coat polysaccharide biosynthesis predicted glycosyltransferase SpsG
VFSIELPDTCDFNQDATMCRRYLHGLNAKVDWLIVDHYGLDARWEIAMRTHNTPILVIDDLANRHHDCDVLVDPGMARIKADYFHLLPASADTLLGSKYAILKPAFSLHHASAPVWPVVRRAHVFFGSGTAAEWLPACVDALMQADSTIEIFALGLCKEHAMAKLAEEYGDRLKWSPYKEEMVSHYSQCSVAIGSPGAATWERACIGLPSAVFATAENQIPILEKLNQLGLCRYLGPAWQWSKPQLIEELNAFLNENVTLASMRATGVAAVDGRGAERIVGRLLAKDLNYA